MIFNIRGTSGSGKSHLMRALMAHFTDHPEFGSFVPIPQEGSKKAYGYWTAPAEDGTKGMAVVGDYSNICGGCDGIKTQDEICARVWKLAQSHHTFFEGLLISHIYGRYRDMARRANALPRPDRFGIEFLFLDTPLDLCLERVAARRAARDNTTPLDPTNTIQKWNDARRVFAKAEADGLDPLWVPHDRALEFLIDRLTEADRAAL